MTCFQELSPFSNQPVEEFSRYLSEGSYSGIYGSDSYPAEEDFYPEEGTPLAQERILFLNNESPSLEDRATLFPFPDGSVMPHSLECPFLQDAVFDPYKEIFPNLPFVSPVPHALQFQLEASIQPKEQKRIPQAANVLTPLARLSNEKATQAIAMAVESARETKQAQFIKGRECGLSRSLMVTGSGDIYLLFNRKKQGDLPLGKGRFKNVSAALNLKTGKVVAFLSIKKEFSTDLDRNQREFTLASDLNIGVIPGSFIDRGTKTAWLAKAMDGDLKEGIHHHKIDLSTGEKRLDLSLQILDQLSGLHNLGIIHMDVKPANMLFCHDSEENCSVFLGDLGLSIIDPSQQIRLGTSRFLSPESVYIHYYNLSHIATERLLTNYVTPKHDSWAMGLSLFCMFRHYLDPTFVADNPRLVRHSVEPESKIQNLNFENWFAKQLSQEKWMTAPLNKKGLEWVIWNLLQIDPTKRWTPEQAANSIRSLQKEHVSPPITIGEAERSPMSISSLTSSSSSASESSMSSGSSSSSSSSNGRWISPHFL